MPKLMDRPVTQARAHADLRHRLSKLFGIERRADSRSKDQVAFVVPPPASNQSLRLLSQSVMLQDLYQRRGKMESPPASLRLQIVQMHARLVANQLATH